MSQQPSGAGLGLRSNPGHEDVDDPVTPDDDLMEMFEDEDSPTDIPGEREDLTSYPDTDEPEPEGIPGGLAAVPSGDDLVTPGTTEAEIDEEADRLAGIYATVPELENGYKELQGGFTRVSQAYRQLEADRLADRQALEDMEDRYEQLVGLIQQREAENDPEFAERLAQSERLRQEVDARVAPIEEQYEQQAEQAQNAQRQQAAAMAIGVFQGRHPEITPNSPEDRQIAAAFRELRTAGVPLDIINVEHMELALEAARNPALKMELSFSPQAVNIPGGIDVLRQRVGATIAATGGTPTPGTRPPAQGQAGRRPSAHVERGSGGAPVVTAPGKQPDEFDEAMKWYSDEFRKGPLFGSGR